MGLGSFSVGDLLLGIHAMGAAILKVPELEISKDESQRLGDAIQSVAAQYNHVIDPKVAAWIQLSIVGGAVYGTRIAAYRIRMKRETEALKVTKPNGHVNGAPKHDIFTVQPLDDSGL